MNSAHYEAAYAEIAKATAKFQAAQTAYRSMKIGDAEYMDARAEYEAADAKFEAAAALEVA
jgi:hypothetical protein